MNSLVTFFSFAVLVGLSSCMRVLEYDGEDDERTPNLGGWGFSFSFGREGKLATSEDNLSAAPVKCSTKICKLCNDSNFQAKFQEDEVTYKYRGCVDISKTKKDTYSISLNLDNQKIYTNTYEVNEVAELPCKHAKKIPNDAYVCPILYDVDLQKGKFCGKLVETFKIHETQIHHEVELGCIIEA